MESLEHVQGVAGLKKHKMKLITAVFMMFSIASGGAFGIEDMISLSGPGVTVVALIALPIFYAIPVALMCAEMGSLIPKEGGIYVWVKEALGEMWGFLVIWWETVMLYLCSAAYIVLMVGYGQKIFGYGDTAAFAIKVALIVLFIAINFKGVGSVGKVSSILSMIVVVAFAVVAIVGFANWNYNPVEPFAADYLTPNLVLGGTLAIGIWMYCGYESFATLAGELENPQVIPKGLLIAVPLVALTYLLPTLGGLATLGHWELWSTTGDPGTIGYTDVMINNLGPAAGVVFTFVAICGQAAMFNSYMAAAPRGFFILADEKLCPQILANVTKKTGVPMVAIILFAIVTFFMVTFDFSYLTMLIAPLGATIYVTLAVSAHILRKKYPVKDREGLFVVPGGTPVFIFVTVAPSLVGLINIFYEGIDYFALGSMTLLSGVVAYIVFKKMYGGLNKIDAVKYPINPRTKLAVGDMRRIGIFLIIVGAAAVFASFFVAVYQGDEYGIQTLAESHAPGSILGNFYALSAITRWAGLAVGVFGAVLFGVFNKKDNAKALENVC